MIEYIKSYVKTNGTPEKKLLVDHLTKIVLLLQQEKVLSTRITII